MRMWCLMASDYLSDLLFLYIPAIYLLQPRKGNRYVMLFLCTAALVCWGIPARQLYMPKNTMLYMVVNFLVMYLIVICFFKGSIRQYAAGFWVLVLELVISEVLSCAVAAILMPEFWAQYMHPEYEADFLYTTRILSSMPSGVVDMTLVLIYLCLIQKRRWGVFWGFMLIPVYQFCLTIGFAVISGDYSERTALRLLGLICFSTVLNFVVLYLLEGIFKKLDREEELQALEWQRRQEYDWYEKDSRYVEEMSMLRHDFANQLQTVYAMMEEPENAEKVKTMLQDMEKGIRNSQKSDNFVGK